MGRIFACAKNVEVWSDETPALNQLYLDFPLDISRTVTRAHCKPVQLSNLENMNPLIAHTFVAYLDTGDWNKAQAKRREVIESAVLQNENWTRAWITQDVCFARSAIIHTDDGALTPLTDLVLMRWLYDKLPDTPFTRLANHMKARNATKERAASNALEHEWRRAPRSP